MAITLQLSLFGYHFKAITLWLSLYGYHHMAISIAFFYNYIVYKDTKDLSYASIKKQSIYLRENYDEEVLFHATKQTLQPANPKAKALFGKIILDPLGLTEAIAYVKKLENQEPVLTHEDFFKIHDNVSDISLNKLNEIATVLRHGWSKIVYWDLLSL